MSGNPEVANPRHAAVVCGADLLHGDQLLFRCDRCRVIRSSLALKGWPADLLKTPLADLLDAGRLRCQDCGDAPSAVQCYRIIESRPMTMFLWTGPENPCRRSDTSAS